MEALFAQPWVQHLFDWWFLTQERLEEMPWQPIDEWLSRFVFYYPLLMAYVWMIGGIIYYLRWERNRGNVLSDLPVLPDYPMVSILVPCYNEG